MILIMEKKHQFIHVEIGNNDLHYGNTGCGIFKGGTKNQLID